MKAKRDCKMIIAQYDNIEVIVIINMIEIIKSLFLLLQFIMQAFFILLEAKEINVKLNYFSSYL